MINNNWKLSYQYLLDNKVLIPNKQVNDFTLISGEIKTFGQLLFKNGNLRKSLVSKISKVNYTGQDLGMQITSRDQGGWVDKKPFSIIVK